MQGAHLQESVSFIRSKTRFRPSTALILGSGLGDFADQLQQRCVIRSAEIPHYPVSTVQGHEGKLIFGKVVHRGNSSPPLLVFKGRIHYYETGNLDSVVYPLLLAHRLGARTLLVTNAAGGINTKFRSGDLMLITDIINLTFLTPTDFTLQKNRPKTSLKKVDLRVVNRSLLPKGSYFDVQLQNAIRSAARKSALRLREGTYCWLKGPTYETAAEIRMLGLLGADAVGMSTVPEIVTGKKLGMKVAAISLISNLATGISQQKLSHQEVTETADSVKEVFTSLMRDVLLHA